MTENEGESLTIENTVSAVIVRDQANFETVDLIVMPQNFGETLPLEIRTNDGALMFKRWPNGETQYFETGRFVDLAAKFEAIRRRTSSLRDHAPNGEEQLNAALRQALDDLAFLLGGV